MARVCVELDIARPLPSRIRISEFTGSNLVDSGSPSPTKVSPITARPARPLATRLPIADQPKFKQFATSSPRLKRQTACPLLRCPSPNLSSCSPPHIRNWPVLISETSAGCADT
ncbi:hypothetical protein HPP92_007361 [Vanilla planifolia]|uniref:Uncharacterized protein n=1 Tax=Vanilla planifolia TaxID=51239 RepID=A0A835RI15_VANPL|nr:hypothetical protein HPP92_007361 [Vanilla planifolia]